MHRQLVVGIRTLRSAGTPTLLGMRTNRSWLAYAHCHQRARQIHPKKMDRAPLVETPASNRLVAARDSGSGAPAAPAGVRLRLLPSGPDLVHEPTPRGTRAIDAPKRRSDRSETPRRGVQ